MKLTTRRTLLALVATGALVTGGVFGTRYWHDREAEKAAAPVVKLTAIHMTTLLRLYGSENPTIREIVAKSEATVSEVDKAVVQLRSTADTAHPTVVQAIDFMESAQGAARNLEQMTRKMVALSVSIDSLQRATDDATSSNQYTREYALRSASTQLSATTKAQGELAASQDAAAKSLADLRVRNDAIARRYGAAATIEQKPITQMIEYIAKMKAA